VSTLRAYAEAARLGNLKYFEERQTQLGELAGQTDEDGRSLLHLAAASGNVPLLSLLAQYSKQTVNSHDEEGKHSMHASNSQGRHEIITQQVHCSPGERVLVV